MAMSHVMGNMFVESPTGGGWSIPGFTSSFIFTTWAMMFATKRYGHAIWPSTPPPGPAEQLISGSSNPVQVTVQEFKWTAKEFIIATLKGVSQVTFVENWKTSFLPLTWQTFLMAVLATVACSVIVMPALQRFFGMWGLPALTGPFVFTAFTFMLAISNFSHIPAGIGWSRPPGG
jgi:urea transporter